MWRLITQDDDASLQNIPQMQIQIAAFCKEFNEKTAHIKPGIVLRTEITVNVSTTIGSHYY